MHCICAGSSVAQRPSAGGATCQRAPQGVACMCTRVAKPGSGRAYRSMSGHLPACVQLLMNRHLQCTVSVACRRVSEGFAPTTGRRMMMSESPTGTMLITSGTHGSFRFLSCSGWFPALNFAGRKTSDHRSADETWKVLHCRVCFHATRVAPLSDNAFVFRVLIFGHFTSGSTLEKYFQ